MIIELKDLPPNQKIKNISVNITFDDEGEPGSSVTIDSNSNNSSNKTESSETVNTRTDVDSDDMPGMPDIPDRSEHKEIPDEMKNLEF